MNIAIIGARGIPGRYGGFETFAAEIAPRLVERGIRVTVYCRPRFSLPSRPASYMGVKLVYLPALPVRSLETLSHEAISLAHSIFRRPDAILVLGLRSSLLYAPYTLLGGRAFFNTDGIEWRRGKWGRVARTYLRLSELIATMIAPHHLIADSRAIARHFLEAYGVSPTYLTYGANLVTERKPAMIEKYGLAAHNYFLVVCRLEPENNVHTIVKAFGSVDCDRELVIVGGSGYRSAYADGVRASASPRVRFLGPVYERADIDQLYANAYAYIHGHEVGGTNPALLQAMGAGCCILANDVPYNREVLGGAGLYWRAKTSDLEERIIEVIASPALADGLRTRAQSRAQTEYSWERVADEYAAFLQNRIVLGTRGSSDDGNGAADT